METPLLHGSSDPLLLDVRRSRDYRDLGQNMHGLLMDTCTNIVWEGLYVDEIPRPRISPPAGSGQTANVVITGDSSNIVIKDFSIDSGAGACNWF